jgi:hypothetical protein
MPITARSTDTREQGVQVVVPIAPRVLQNQETNTDEDETPPIFVRKPQIQINQVQPKGVDSGVTTDQGLFFTYILDWLLSLEDKIQEG